MKLVFTEGSAQSDRMDVLRTCEVVETFDVPRQRILPHDMMHDAIESTLSARLFLHRSSKAKRQRSR